MSDDDEGHSCPECDSAPLEVLDSVTFESCLEPDAAIDVERVCIGDQLYVGIRLRDFEDAGEACKWIIDNDGANAVGVIWHASVARMIAAAILNAADKLDGLQAEIDSIPDSLEGLS